MCGRYYFASEQETPAMKKIIEDIKKRYENTPELLSMKTGEIFPTETVPIVTAERPVLMKWGFPRFDGKGQVINARLETADEKPMFRRAFNEMRCLVPANNYFEWEKIGNIKKKYAIGLHRPIYMAGFYRFDNAMQTPQFIILTRPAAKEVEFIHDRMPVILTDEMQYKWLNENIGTQDMMKFVPEELDYRDV
jgi:putative SOS response-associated peptidase YedK